MADPTKGEDVSDETETGESKGEAETAASETAASDTSETATSETGAGSDEAAAKDEPTPQTATENEPPSPDDNATAKSDDAGAGTQSTDAHAQSEDNGGAATVSGSGIDFKYFGRTEVGLVREHNEDNFVILDLDGNAPKMIGAEPGEISEGGGAAERSEGETQPPPGVATGTIDRGLVLGVCDGMGGAAAGEVASAMAVETIAELMSAGPRPSDRDAFAHRLVFAIEEAGSRIFSSAKMDRSRRGMGTTATVAGLVDNILFVGQVGDSRCYVMRDGDLGLITKDQSLVNQLIEAGQLTEEEAEAFEHSNIILQALGTTEEVTVDLTFFEVRRGDRIMLCSDGLSGLVHADMIKEVMAEEAELPACCARLIEMANAGGGHDNITCIVCDFSGEGLKPLEDATVPMYSQYPLPPAEQYAEELPVRESSMKTGTRKPGSDVKRDVYDVTDDERDSGGFPWWLVAAVFLVIAIVAVVFGMRDGMSEGSSDRTSDGTTDPTPEIPPFVPEPPPVEEVAVTVRTDVDGELYVDNRFRQELQAGRDVTLELLPGAYRLEARVAGSTVADETVTVQDGEPLSVELNMPEGAVGLEPVNDVEPPPETADDTDDEGTGGSPNPMVQERPEESGGETSPPTEMAPSTTETPRMRPTERPPTETTTRMRAVMQPILKREYHPAPENPY